MKQKEEKEVSVVQVCKCNYVNFKSLKTFELSTNKGILNYNYYFDTYDKELYDKFIDKIKCLIQDFFEDNIYELYKKIPSLPVDSIEYVDLRISNNYTLSDDCIDFNVYFENMSKHYLLNIITQHRNKFNDYLLDNYNQKYTLFIGRSEDLNVCMEIKDNYISFINSFVNNTNNNEDDFYFTVCLDFLISLYKVYFPLMKYNLTYIIKEFCKQLNPNKLE
jgi:hypothetical protein